MKLKYKKKEVLLVVIILIIQTVIFIIAGINKSYIHMDEAYSFGLASYNKIDIVQNDDFFNVWHNKEYYEDYLTLNESEKNTFFPVYENQKNDNHPPLYYLFLRLAMIFHMNSYSKWTGLILNFIIYCFITIFTYLISKKLLEKNKCYKEKSAILALVSSITLSSINNAIYIRMYALSTLNIVVTTYLHMKLLEQKKTNYKTLLLIGIFALLGSLTHYYYLFYLSMLSIMFVIKYIKEKNYEKLVQYLLTMLLAGIISLVIFPYSIQHMFFGCRGQETISNLYNFSEFLSCISQYLVLLNIYNFNNMLFIISLFALFIIIYKRIKGIKIFDTKNKYTKYISYPTLCYAILVAISAPWKALRYIMPIGNLVFLLVFYYIIILLKNIIKEQTLNKVIIGIFLLIMIMPVISNSIIDIVIGKKFRNEQENLYTSKKEFVSKLQYELILPIDIVYTIFNDDSIDNTLLFIKDYKIEPEVLFSNKKNIVNLLKNKSNLPALYLLNSQKNRFLDDILLFSYISESYIAKDIECNEETINNIIKGRDISNGIVIFVNDGQQNDDIAKEIKDILDLKKITYLKRLNSCDVYLIE